MVIMIEQNFDAYLDALSPGDYDRCDQPATFAALKTAIADTVSAEFPDAEVMIVWPGRSNIDVDASDISDIDGERYNLESETARRVQSLIENVFITGTFWVYKD